MWINQNGYRETASLLPSPCPLFFHREENFCLPLFRRKLVKLGLAVNLVRHPIHMISIGVNPGHNGAIGIRQS